MLPTESQGTVRRALDIEDYIDILRRHKAWIFAPTFAALVIAVVVAFLWPDTYVSTAIIRIAPSQIPEAYVPSNVTTDMQERLNNLEQLILSRATLTTIINNFNLYQKERARMPIDDVVEIMKAKDIRIGTVQALGQPGTRSLPAFSIGFANSNRFVAQRVAENLVSRFIEENMRETSQDSASTTEFLQRDWEDKHHKMEQIEQRLSDFRSRNLGKLPEEQGANLQALSSMQGSMINLNASMSRISQDKLLLENQLRTFKDQQAALKDPAQQSSQAEKQKNDKLAAKDREIAAYEDALASARERYKDTHPDVQRLVSMIALSKKQRDALLKEEQEKKPESAPTRPPDPQYVREMRDYDAAIRRVQTQIQAKDMENAEYQKEASRITQDIKSYQGRLDGLPVGTKEYEELLRDRAVAQKEYEEAEAKLNSSKIATRINTGQQGEKLETLDPASIPQTPSEPKRPIIVAIGTALGLALGLALAVFRELKDTSLKNLKDVRAYTQLPVLGSIPLLENDVVVRRRRRLAWLAWCTASLVGAVVMCSSVVYYYTTKL